MHYKDARILLAHKNFAAHKHVSHIGLGVSALCTAKVLRALGVKVDVKAVSSANDIKTCLAQREYTHVIVSAPWIPTVQLAELAHEWPDMYFAVNVHSRTGFLQADRNGVKLFREEIELQTGTHNFHVSGNSDHFVKWVHNAFGVPCAHLPNLYFLDGHTPHHRHHHHGGGDVLRIGAFGATRPLKNFMTAAGAALEIAKELRRPLEFWLSAKRTEGGGDVILQAIHEMLQGIPGVTIKYNDWATWPQFREVVGHMHLLMQVSFSESFNLVTADGVAMGVPSVVSHAITWAPQYWMAEPDDVVEVAQAGRRILNHPDAARDGLAALLKHNSRGCRAWAHSLGLEGLPHYHPPSFELREAMEMA